MPGKSTHSRIVKSSKVRASSSSARWMWIGIPGKRRLPPMWSKCMCVITTCATRSTSSCGSGCGFACHSASSSGVESIIPVSTRTSPPGCSIVWDSPGHVSPPTTTSEVRWTPISSRVSTSGAYGHDHGRVHRGSLALLRRGRRPRAEVRSHRRAPRRRRCGEGARVTASGARARSDPRPHRGALARAAGGDGADDLRRSREADQDSPGRGVARRLDVHLRGRRSAQARRRRRSDGGVGGRRGQDRIHAAAANRSDRRDLAVQLPVQPRRAQARPRPRGRLPRRPQAGKRDPALRPAPCGARARGGTAGRLAHRPCRAVRRDRRRPRRGRARPDDHLHRLERRRLGTRRTRAQKRVRLELGNSTPVVIAEDADLDAAAQKLATNAFSFAGQSCISVQRIYVLRPVLDAFLERFVPRVEALVVGDPAEEDTDVGPVIDSGNRDRIVAWVEEALGAGAHLVTGSTDADPLSPLVIADAPESAKIVCDEVFGPVCVVNPVDSLEDAYERANATDYGLQAGIFTGSLSTALAAAEALEFGGVTVNEAPTFRADQMPYGGIKGSGNTKEGPAYTIREMTEERLIVLAR